MWCQVQANPYHLKQGCPMIRSKHAMCVASDGKIYLYGGKSMSNKALRDLWRFDASLCTWKQLTAEEERTQFNKKPSSRSVLGDKSNRQSNESLNSNGSVEWSRTPPPPLQEHTIIAFKQKLYVFGGEIGYSSDETPLWIFDLVDFKWRKFFSTKSFANMNTVSRPLGRRCHTAVLFHDSMYIYGGYQDLKGSSSEMWSFDLNTEEWYLEGNAQSKKDFSPMARHGHSAVVYKDSMFVYGGMSNLSMRSDFWSWNFNDRVWSRLKTFRKHPGDLAYHSAIVFFNSMFIYGGERSDGSHTNELWRFYFENESWEHIEIKGLAPSCHTRHVAITNPNALFKPSQKSRKLNQNRKKRVKELSCFSVSTQTSTNAEDHLKSISMCFDQTTAINTSTVSEQSKAISQAINKYSKFFVSISQANSDEEEKKFSIKNCFEQANQNKVIDESSNHAFDKPFGSSFPKHSNSFVRMRPRKPILQRQRPYSDFFDVIPPQRRFHDNHHEFDTDLNFDDKQFIRRSVQESMSYYSLCWPTPPASIKRKDSALALVSPSSTNCNKEEQVDDQKQHSLSNISLKHKSNTSSTQKPFLKGDQYFSDNQTSSSSGNHPVAMVGSQLRTQSRRNRSGRKDWARSINLDISPDFEKELDQTVNSTTASISPISNPNEPMIMTPIYNETTTQQPSISHINLDMLEDYFEPEEMLEIVTETCTLDDDHFINDSLAFNLKTIQKTPVRKQALFSSASSSSCSPTSLSISTGNEESNNINNVNSEKKTQRKPFHQSCSDASVSHSSSSGYQSLALTDSSNNGIKISQSLDLVSDPSISNSSSFGQEKKQEDEEFYHLKSVIVNNESKKILLKLESDELIEMTNLNDISAMLRVKELKPKKFEPNRCKSIINQVIGEECSNTLHISIDESNVEIDETDDDDSEFEYEDGVQFGRENNRLRTSTKKQLSHQHSTFAMYVFGGKDDCITGVLNKQSMTIWKFYI